MAAAEDQVKVQLNSSNLALNVKKITEHASYKAFSFEEATAFFRDQRAWTEAGAPAFIFRLSSLRVPGVKEYFSIAMPENPRGCLIQVKENGFVLAAEGNIFVTYPSPEAAVGVVLQASNKRRIMAHAHYRDAYKTTEDIRRNFEDWARLGYIFSPSQKGGEGVFELTTTVCLLDNAVAGKRKFPSYFWIRPSFNGYERLTGDKQVRSQHATLEEVIQLVHDLPVAELVKAAESNAENTACDLIVKYGAHPEQVLGSGETVLMRAITRWSSDSVDLLINYGANVLAAAAFVPRSACGANLKPYCLVLAEQRDNPTILASVTSALQARRRSDLPEQGQQKQQQQQQQAQQRQHSHPPIHFQFGQESREKGDKEDPYQAIPKPNHVLPAFTEEEIAFVNQYIEKTRSEYQMLLSRPEFLQPSVLSLLQSQRAAFEKQITEITCTAFTLDIMRNPVMAEDGHTYELKSLEEYLTKKECVTAEGECPKSPVNTKSISRGRLVQNMGTRKIIEGFIEAGKAFQKKAEHR